MDKDTLLARLNWFYSLELNQVDLYMAQSKKVEDTYTSVTFERVAFIEQQHADNIAETIKEFGGKPTSLGDVIAPIIGSFVGTLLPLVGLGNSLKVNILLEERAMQDYQNLINAIQDDQGLKELLKILQFNQIDEDFHTAWFSEKLKKLQEPVEKH